MKLAECSGLKSFYSVAVQISVKGIDCQYL